MNLRDEVSFVLTKKLLNSSAISLIFNFDNSDE